MGIEMTNIISGKKDSATLCIVDNSPRAMIAMSGGVDSSVAALLMKETGYDCTGVTMRLYREPGFRTSCAKSCCSDEDEEDAAFVCHQLGIPHESACFSRLFAQKVIQKFIHEYEDGRTPNPCIDCNRFLKFEALMGQALSEGYDVLVTGHYARVRYCEELDRWQLLKALDVSKDQSYVLYMLTQAQLRHLRLPLGELSKTETRRIAEKHGLVNAKKHDSQDICFIPNGDYSSFLERWTGKAYPPGEIVDQAGNVLGPHNGLIRYTLGQRRGLHLAMGKPVYVLGKDLAHNTLIVGTEDALYRRELIASDFNWLSTPEPREAIRATARTRYHQTEHAATAFPLPNGQVKVIFDEPQRAITPGQAVVLYEGELVLGGGTILSYRADE